MFIFLLSVSFVLGNLSYAVDQEPAPEPNTLSAAQKEAGWKLLFDGKTTGGWRGYRSEHFPEKGWIVEDGTLKVCAGGGGGDILTEEEFQDFDIQIEWKVAEGANSGIMYRVGEEENAPWKTGAEFQIYDDKGRNLDPTSRHSAGAMYDLYAPPAHKPVKPAGEWNQARIIALGDHIEYWHNGVQTAECNLSSKDWVQRRDKSKFAKFPNFTRMKKGRISLQDHGNDVWFRSIKIRDLTLKSGQKPIPLFNGKDLTGWTYFLNEEGKMEDTWHVKDGILICKGQPIGYIRTEKDYTHFILRLQWRFNPITKKAGNSGVLFRQVGPDQVWPRSIEAQLQSGSAGDFWNIEKFPMKTDPDRTRGRNTKKTHFNENPVGEWNTYEIIADQGNITLIVNGEVLNRAKEAAELPGKICLQSEGAEIHFRNICLIPLNP
jgi:hypothetical protein